MKRIKKVFSTISLIGLFMVNIFLFADSLPAAQTLVGTWHYTEIERDFGELGTAYMMSCYGVERNCRAGDSAWGF